MDRDPTGHDSAPSGDTPRPDPGSSRLGGGGDLRVLAARVLDDLHRISRQLAIEEGLGPGERPPEESLRLEVSVSLDPRRPVDQRGPDGLIGAIRQAVRVSLQAAVAIRPGRVYCLQCGTADCAHAAPESDTMVFAGYGPSGKPRFLEFPHLLMDLGDPRAASLFGDHPAVVALFLDSGVLHRDLLTPPAPDCPVRLLGQVCIGMLERGGPAGLSRRERFALTLQAMETRSAGGRSSRLRLNLLGADAEVLSTLARQTGRQGEERLRRLVRRLRDRLDDIGRRAAASRRQGRPMGLEEAVTVLLTRVRGEAERAWNEEGSRTRHAQRRHLDGGRPTPLALSDARWASDERLRYDEERETVVVLGPKGRTHVFTLDGRHVTSLVLGPGEDERKESRRRWRPLSDRELRSFRRSVGSHRASGPTGEG